MAQKQLHTVQLKLEKVYHDELLDFCKRNGVAKADAVRFFLDSVTEVTDVELDRWYDTRR